MTVLGGGILCCSAYAWEWRETFRGSIGWGTRTTLSLRAWAYQRGDSTFLKNKGLAEEKSERTMARRSWWPQVYPSRSSRRNFCICLSHCSVLHGNHPLLPGCRQRWMRRSRKILSKILCLKMYTWLLGSSKSSPCCDSANVEFFLALGLVPDTNHGDMFLTLQLRQGRPALDSAFENSGARIRVETPQCWKCESVAFWSAFKKIDLGNNSKPVSSSFLPWGLLSHEGLANSCGSLVWVESEFCASNHATAIWTQERNTSQTQVRESATESATERATWQNTL